MKMLIKGILFLVLVVTLIVGCNKEDNSNPKVSSSSQIKTKDKKTTFEKSGVMTYEINSEFLVDEILTLTDETFNEDYLNENPNTIVTIEPSIVPNKLTVTITPDGNGEPIPPSTDKIVCSGSGYSFASCVSNWFDVNPDGCLGITQNNGTYYADDEGCA